MVASAPSARFLFPVTETVGMDAKMRISRDGVIAVLRGIKPDTVVETASALHTGGVAVVEVTADTPDAADMIRTLTEEFDDLLVGAGTVLDPATVRETVVAGASFVVAPSYDEAVVQAVNRHGALAIPGVLTPTEAVRAVEAGAGAVKLFPASTVGPGHLSALQGPLPDIDVIPTGGVTPASAGQFIDAGALAVGAGSALVPEDAVEQGDFETITDRAESFRTAVADAGSD